MNKVFFTSDTHFGHTNIIKYCDRPFNNVDSMNEALVYNWNTKVSKDSTVYHLGDFAFLDESSIKDLIWSLNGRIVFIPGNHDKNLIKALEKFNFDGKATLASLIHSETFNIEDEKIRFVMCHYAMKVWDKSHYGAIHLYGHSHGSLPDDKNSRSMDVGVDTNNYTPYSIDEILTIMYKKVYKPVDHHI